MSRDKITPITVTRAVNTACDPACRLFPDFQGGTLTDASCDARGAGFYTSIANATFVPEGLRVVVDESATSFLQNGAGWTIAALLNSPAFDYTVDVIFTLNQYVDAPGGGVAGEAKVLHIGQSEVTSNYLSSVWVDPYVGGNQADVRFSLAFVGFSTKVRVNFGEKVHIRMHKPATVSAGNPERYFINGVQVLTRDIEHSISNVDTLLFGGYSGSAPSSGALTVTYHEARITQGLVAPTDGSGFTPPAYLPPPRFVTGLGDPVVTVGAPTTPLESDAETYTATRAATWGWGMTGSVAGPQAVATVGAGTQAAPPAAPASVSWVVDFPPYPSDAEPAYEITFDATSWDLSAIVQTRYRNRAVVAEGVFLPKTRYTDPGWPAGTEDGAQSLSAAAAADCASVGGWVAETLAQIGGFEAPAKDVCPIRAALPAAGTPFGDTPPVPVLGMYPVADFSPVIAIGRPSDGFTLTLTSVGALPMTISGVDWTGWFFNNTRRI